MRADHHQRQPGSAARRRDRRLDLAVGYAILAMFIGSFLALAALLPDEPAGTAAGRAPAADSQVAANGG